MLNSNRMEVLHTETYIQISYDPLTHILICDWLGFQTIEGIQKAGGIILMIIKAKLVTKVLNSNLKVTGPWTDATEWTISVWFPSIIAAGVQHFAWVQATNPFAALSAKKAMPVDSIVMEFDNYQEAWGWLILI